MLRNIWTTLADGQPIQHKEPGQLIYLQETRAECFYYIISGTVKCYISSPEGEERILTLPHAGELIGEAAFFDQQPRMSSAIPRSWGSCSPTPRCTICSWRASPPW